MSMEAVIVLRHPALPLTLHFALHCRSGLGEQLRDRTKYTTLFLVTHGCWNFGLAYILIVEQTCSQYWS